jgi:hypothetical protein
MQFWLAQYLNPLLADGGNVKANKRRCAFVLKF